MNDCPTTIFMPVNAETVMLAHTSFVGVVMVEAVTQAEPSQSCMASPDEGRLVFTQATVFPSEIPKGLTS